MQTFSLKKDFTILKAETGKYMLYTPYKKYYIPELFYRIIHLLQKGYSIDEIEAQFNGEITKKEIEKIIEESFFRMGIINGSCYDRSKKKRLLVWRKDIINPTQLYNKQITSLLFHKFFIAFFLVGYIIVYGYGTYKFGSEQIFDDNYFTLDKGVVAGIYLIIFYLSSFVHELGHYFTSIWLGANPGKIGIGIYIITPVLYVSLDDVWRLSAKKRNIINIAGVYFQSVFLLLFAFIALIFNLKIPFVICFLGSMGILINLLPFVKFDGYWMVNDYLDTNNLMDRAINYLLGIMGIKKCSNGYTSDNSFKVKIFKIYSFCLGIFLLIYGIVFVKIFHFNSVVLYEIIVGKNKDINIVWLALRSLFIIITSIKVISILRGIIRGRARD